MPVYFEETPKEELKDIVSINVNATLRVTYAILPGMISRLVWSSGYAKLEPDIRPIVNVV